ncbi:MAG: isochorismate synthase [Flavobacteriaceae bacterium]|nr:isochorismate synthase [Flavobacteriaceae bacterium]
MDPNTLLKFITSIKPDESLMLLRFPREQKIYGYIGKTTRSASSNLKGVVFAPFNNREKPYILTPTKTHVFKALSFTPSEKSTVNFQENFQAYATHFQAFSKAIHRDAFKKLVLSRSLLVSENIGLSASFLSACAAYPNACCYLWYSSDTGYWLGASPEVLVEQIDRQISTYALAATKSVEDTSPWTAKEKEEQAFVTQYILELLETAGLNPVASKTIEAKAGNLKHLKTVITATLTPKTTALSIAKQLHPTPAVAGLPKKEAIDFILKNEGYDRKFYTGYFGLLQQNTARLFVNLRCLQYVQHKTYIYVGGGLTKDSELSSEWQETQNKSKTMLDILQLKAD